MQILKPYVPMNGPLPDVRDYAGLLLRLAARDRAAVEKHVAVCEAEATLDHVNLWKRVACLLCNLAPKAAQAAGQRAVQFFAADGKYRRQVFAMEDLRDGVLAVYMVDVLEEARRQGLMRAPITRTIFLGLIRRRSSGIGISRAPDRYWPVMLFGEARMSAGLPSATMWPPCTPAAGPMSMT